MSRMAIFLFPPCFVLGVQTPFVNFISFIPVHQGFFLISIIFLKGCFRRILKASPLTNPFLTLGG